MICRFGEERDGLSWFHPKMSSKLVPHWVVEASVCRCNLLIVHVDAIAAVLAWVAIAAGPVRFMARTIAG